MSAHMTPRRLSPEEIAEIEERSRRSEDAYRDRARLLAELRAVEKERDNLFLYAAVTVGRADAERIRDATRGDA